MADKEQSLIVVKRIKRNGGGGHGGGSWKVAYADFVTAMMAFFLLMWLLGSVGDYTKKGIAEYFNTPIEAALTRGTAISESSNIIPGGGDDITRKEGDVKVSEEVGTQFPVNLDEARQEWERQERTRLQELEEQIEQAIDANPLLKQFKKQILLDITTEGLRIQIVDEQNRPMFATGRDELKSYTIDILHEIGRVLNSINNRISISGHTDASNYANNGSGYTNWELSSDRANAARRELIIGGMVNEKILRIIGLSSAVPFDKDDPLNPMNRRISIVVLNKKTENAITEQENGGKVNISDTPQSVQGVQQKLAP
ncbi:flagellar motor protein MotB [Candidatus Methylospira mobilis]|uniref:Flagellar motor protein MotB n=1 Tax=Candidatus Methylospira mobilis TaxID=1808979 RepID=A0A5Q0BF13_9GAMM|nr:flagellar motor protein MotB [Candidatus Methylospira mobilis]QFY42420.1 flagellar motor protein MotB [Candidatus Methylospira mobilis]WNV04478.1 flagellar motor protein MotB [Candidatus Methylospira mobilis]